MTIRRQYTSRKIRKTFYKINKLINKRIIRKEQNQLVQYLVR